MAQSINRSIPSMLNPQKKFFLPVVLNLDRQNFRKNSRQDTEKKYLPNSMRMNHILKYKKK